MSDLAGAGVLVTRPRAQAAALVEAIEAHGGRAIVHPTIAIVPPHDPQALQGALARLEDYDWVLLTSANAAHALLAGKHARPRALACVGASTARVCENGGLTVDLIPAEFNAEALLAALESRLGPSLPGVRFLLLAAAEARETLAAGLRARGADVEVVVAYRTVPALENAASLLADMAAVDVLTFASPSAVEAFDRMVGDAYRNLPAVCIGEVTGRRALALGYGTVQVAPQADAGGLVGTLVRMLRSARGEAGNYPAK